MTNTREKTRNKYKEKAKENENEKANRRPPKENKPEPSVLARLLKASIEGLAIEVAMNTVIPGSGIALKGMKNAKNIKKAGKAMGKSAAKEGGDILDGEDENNSNSAGGVSEEAAMEILTHLGGRG